MDVYCPKCSEPFDPDEFHGWEGRDYETNRRLFFSQGCEGMGMRCSDSPPQTVAGEPDGFTKGEACAALAELLGDDVDGIASTMDDFGFMFD